MTSSDTKMFLGLSSVCNCLAVSSILTFLESLVLTLAVTPLSISVRGVAIAAKFFIKHL